MSVNPAESRQNDSHYPDLGLVPKEEKKRAYGLYGRVKVCANSCKNSMKDSCFNILGKMKRYGNNLVNSCNRMFFIAKLKTRVSLLLIQQPSFSGLLKARREIVEACTTPQGKENLETLKSLIKSIDTTMQREIFKRIGVAIEIIIKGVGVYILAIVVAKVYRKTCGKSCEARLSLPMGEKGPIDVG
ncbi:MAG: hypothetical protein AAGE99_02355 [Chlamydiota bacterium]